MKYEIKESKTEMQVKVSGIEKKIMLSISDIGELIEDFLKRDGVIVPDNYQIIQESCNDEGNEEIGISWFEPDIRR